MVEKKQEYFSEGIRIDEVDYRFREIRSLVNCDRNWLLNLYAIFDHVESLVVSHPKEFIDQFLPYIQGYVFRLRVNGVICDEAIRSFLNSYKLFKLYEKIKDEPESVLALVKLFEMQDFVRVSIDHFESFIYLFETNEKIVCRNLNIKYVRNSEIDKLILLLKRFSDVDKISFLEGLDIFSIVISKTIVELMIELLNKTELKKLSLKQCSFDFGVAEILFRSPYLKNLEELDISDCNISREAMVVLVSSPYLANLRVLRCCGNDIDVEVLRSLVRSPSISNLEELYMSQVPMQGYLPYLAECSWFSKLKKLDLSWGDLEADDMQFFANLNYELELEVLHLCQNKIAGEGVVTLARSECLNKLKLLFIAGNNNDFEFEKDIVYSPFLTNLVWFNFQDMNMSDEDLIYFSKSPNLKGAEELCLSGNPFGDVGVEVLSKVEALTNITSLDLSYTGMTGKGVVAIAKSSVFSNVTNLNLKGICVDDQAIITLANSSYMANLDVLYIEEECITPLGWEALVNSKYLGHLYRHKGYDKYRK